jgi:hypothetical protein
MQTITIKLAETPSGARRLTVTNVDFDTTTRHYRHRDYGVDLRAQADAIAEEMAALAGVTIIGVLQPPMQSDKWVRTYALTVPPCYACLPLCK